MASVQSHKTCPKCGEQKPLEDFYVDRSTKSGRQTYCKHCLLRYGKQYRAQNKSAISKKNRRYAEENRERLSDYHRRYAEENREALRVKASLSHSTYAQLSESFASVPRWSRWRSEEDSFLIADNGMSIYQKAIKLGRTYDSCRHRMKRLRTQVSA